MAVEDEPDQSQTIQPVLANAQREFVDRPVLERKRVLCKCHTGNVLEEVLPSGTLLVRERTENLIEGLEKLVGCRFVAPVRTKLKSFVGKELRTVRFRRIGHECLDVSR